MYRVRRKMIIWPIALAFCVAALSASAAGTLAQGKSAYEAGDYAVALKIIRPLAEQDDLEAQYLLARMHEKGEGVTKDMVEAAKWYRRAAERGHAAAEYRMAVGYTFGLGDLPKDEAEALRWLRRSACHGHKKAMKMLGGAYERGKLGLAPDPELARYWRDRAKQ
jgi:TPR repeat protein